MTNRYLNIAWQIVLLWLVFRCGAHLVGILHLALPGNVAGMLLMFALLLTGVVKPAQIEAGGGFLLRHFAFFFIPISVGLMAFGPLPTTLPPLQGEGRGGDGVESASEHTPIPLLSSPLKGEGRTAEDHCL